MSEIEIIEPTEATPDFDKVLGYAIAKFQYNQPGNYTITANGEISLADWMGRSFIFKEKPTPEDLSFEVTEVRCDRDDYIIVVVKDPKNGKPPEIQVTVEIPETEFLTIKPVRETKVTDRSEDIGIENIKLYRIERSQETWREFTSNLGRPFPPTDWQSSDDVFGLELNIPKGKCLALSVFIQPSDKSDNTWAGTALDGAVHPVGAACLLLDEDATDYPYFHSTPQSAIAENSKRLRIKSNGFIFYYLDPNNPGQYLQEKSWEEVKPDRLFTQAVEVLVHYKIGTREELLQQAQIACSKHMPTSKTLSIEVDKPFSGITDETFFEIILSTNPAFQKMDELIKQGTFNSNPFALF